MFLKIIYRIFISHPHIVINHHERNAIHIQEADYDLDNNAILSASLVPLFVKTACMDDFLYGFKNIIQTMEKRPTKKNTLK